MYNTHMRIVTLNTWGKYGPFEDRWAFLLDELKAMQPDILCLQEVVEPTIAEKIRNVVSLPYVCSSYEAGLAVLTRFGIASERVLKYEAASETEREDRRVLLANLIIGAAKITVANTHLSWKPEDEPVRLKQTQELNRMLEEFAMSPGILAGDFNDLPASRAIQTIEGAGYLNLSRRFNPENPMITWDNRNPFIQSHSVKFPDRQIDFLFINRKLLDTVAVRRCELVFNRANSKGIFPSDHYGLLADLELRGQATTWRESNPSHSR